MHLYSFTYIINLLLVVTNTIANKEFSNIYYAFYARFHNTELVCSYEKEKKY